MTTRRIFRNISEFFRRFFEVSSQVTTTFMDKMKGRYGLGRFELGNSESKWM